MKRQLSELKSVWYREIKETKDQIDALMKSVFSPKVKGIGYESRPSDTFLTAKTRTLVLSAAAGSGDVE